MTHAKAALAVLLGSMVLPACRDPEGAGPAGDRLAIEAGAPPADAGGGPTLADAKVAVDASPKVVASDAAAADHATTGDAGLSDTQAAKADATGIGDATDSECMTAAVELPWPSVQRTRLEVTANGRAIAAMRRQDTEVVLRTYGFDGAFVAERSFTGGDARVLPHEDFFLVISRTPDHALVGGWFGAGLTTSQGAFSVSSTAQERLLGAIFVRGAPVLFTNQRFVNTASGVSVAWSAALSPQEAKSLEFGRIYGMTATPNQVLLAWGGHALGFMVIEDSGRVVASKIATESSSYAAETTIAFPHGSGLLMVNGNPPRVTQIGFDLATKTLQPNEELPFFYRTAAQIGGFSSNGRPFAFWLTLFPEPDRYNGNKPHQLYGCELDLAAPKACASKVLVAETGLGGYQIVEHPVAATALSGDGFAVVHTDASHRSWLRVGDLACPARAPGGG